jgi:uncharacterized membrane protein
MLALTTYQWLKAFHVISSVLWVGGGVTLVVLGLMTLREKDPRRTAHFTGQVAFLGLRYFAPLSLITFGLGFWLAEEGHWPYDTTFIQIGIVGWIVSFLTGFFFIGPQSGKISRLLAERGPEDAEAQRLIRRLLLVARFDEALLLFIIFVMTAKPWS